VGRDVDDSDEHDDDLDLFALSEDEIRELRPARLARSAASHLALNDITAELRRLNSRDTERISRGLKTRANAPAAALALALRTTVVRLAEEGVVSLLHDAMHHGVLATGRTAELETDELAALLRADATALGFLSHYTLRDSLTDVSEFGVTPATRAALWSSMVCSGHEGAVAALAWLLADPPGFWTEAQTEKVTEAWEAVRARIPGLPEKPASLESLCSIVADLERSGALDSPAAPDLDPATQEQAVPDTENSAPFSAALTAATNRVSDLMARYTELRDATVGPLTLVFHQGVIPPRELLTDLLAFADDMSVALADVADLTGEPETPATLEQALSYLDAAAATVAASDALTRIARLVTLRGPDYVTGDLEQVATVAADVAADTDPALLAALDALVTAVEIGATDAQRTTELARIVQNALPSAGVLVMLAATGALSLTEPEVDAVGETEQPAASSTAAEPGDSTPSDEPGDSTPSDEPVAAHDADTPPPEPAVDPVHEQTVAVPGAGDAPATATDLPEPGPDAVQPAAAAAESGASAGESDPQATDAAESPAEPSAEEATGEAAAETTTAAQAEDADLDDVLADLDLTVPLAGDGDDDEGRLGVPPAAAHDELGAAAPGPAATEPGTPHRPAKTRKAPAAEHAQPNDADDGTPDAPAADIDNEALYATLLNDGQFALAAWLTETVDADPAITAAHRLAAHAAAIRTSSGPNAAAFADTVRHLDADVLHGLPGTQMLVYAAAVRAGVLSPTAGAAAPLRDITGGIVKCGPAVEELTDALLTAIYSGAHLTPRSADAVAETTGLETEHSDLAAAARALLDSASSRTIRYQAATELWKSWMESTGYLGSALALVAAGSRSAEDLKFVRARVTELRSRSTLDQAIDRDTPQHTGRRNRIEARARDKIIEWTSDVADVLAQWVETTEALAQSSTGGGWMASQLADLRTRVAAVRDPALSELQTLRNADRHTRTAAVDAGLALLESSLDLITGAATLDTVTELPADRVANGALALAPHLPLTLSPTLAPRVRAVTVTDVAAAADALAAGPVGWSAAFNERGRLADHVGTQILLEVLRSRDPQLARRLAAARDRDVAAATGVLDEQVARLAERIDSDRLFGRLDDEGWAELSIRARAFEPDSRGTRVDFDTMTELLNAVEEDREKRATAAIEAKWQLLSDVDLTDEQSTRISQCIADGDLTTADEYIETVRTRGELPQPRTEADHLARFFPAFPTLFHAAESAGAGRGPSSPLAALKRAIDAGHNPEQGQLAAVLSGAGLDVADIGRRPAASSRLGQWANLAGSRSLDTKLSQIKPVLEQLGFFAAKASTPASRRGQVQGRSSWMYLTGVRATAGKALIPAFGTAISPSGNTLRILGVWGSPTPGELVEMLRGEPTDHSVLVLYFGTLSVAARRELSSVLRAGRRLPTTAVIDDAAFAYLSVQPEPRRDITMSIALPFAASAPFTPDVAGLVPVEMFYGRTDELDQVVDMMGSCIVYGGRQLGKSALLRAAAREFDDGDVRHAIYQSIYKVGQAIPADAVWTTLWPRLEDKGVVTGDIPAGDVGAAVIRHITDWIGGLPGRQLLLLLDESDFFLDADANDGKFTHVAAFRELMEQTGRAVKVVFAGLHQTARFERLANHPLAHFGNPVCVGPLTPQHAYDLLTRPLRALGYRFADNNIAARVLALANNQPSLIQLFGAQLLARLQRGTVPAGAPPQTVTSADIEAVWSDESLRQSFRKRFDWTLNLDPRYKIIAYSVAFHAHAHGIGSALTPTELRSQCEQWWPQGFAAEDVRTGEFRALLDECVALGVLSYAPADGAYRLRTPNVLALLGSRDEVDDVLDQAELTPLPESFDGSLLRPLFASGPTRSPLTSAQIADLLAARSQVRVIAGSDALTVSRCARVLRDENENAVYGKRSIPIKETSAANLDTACAQAARAAANGHAVVLVDLTSVTHTAATTAWTRARDLIATYTGGTLGIVLITTATQAPLWVRANTEADASSGLTELHRYDNTGLRLWLTETPLPFQDEASRAELLDVTGGWPTLVNKVASTLEADHDHDEHPDALVDLRGWLSQPAHADELVTASGVRDDDTLRQAWDCLSVELQGVASDARDIADLLAVYAEAGDGETLMPDRLVASGYDSTDAVVAVLRILGVLVTSSVDGQLRLEPVIAAASATAGSALG
jgi:hypothetical protein